MDTRGCGCCRVPSDPPTAGSVTCSEFRLRTSRAFPPQPEEVALLKVMAPTPKAWSLREDRYQSLCLPHLRRGVGPVHPTARARSELQSALCYPCLPGSHAGLVLGAASTNFLRVYLHLGVRFPGPKLRRIHNLCVSF